MSDRGIPGIITDGASDPLDVLVIGSGVPRHHHSDGLPVYLVCEDVRGVRVVLKDNTVKILLAYPSHWPAPRDRAPERWLFADHADLTWNALIPCFDKPNHE